MARVFHYATPPRAVSLITELVDPQPGMDVYDPCCGNGRLLFAADRLVASRYAPETGARQQALALSGQEADSVAYLMLRLGAVARGVRVNSARGDTLREPAFSNGAERTLRRFDRIVGNPIWSQRVPSTVYRSDPYGRFPFGTPPEDNADWGWVQHMHTSLTDGGRLAVILDSEVTRRGGPDNSEEPIRRRFVEGGLVEAVLSCGGPFRARRSMRGAVARAVARTGVVLVISKQPRWAGRVLLVDGSPLVDAYARGEASLRASLERVLQIHRQRAVVRGISAIATTREIAAHGCDLTPRRWIDSE